MNQGTITCAEHTQWWSSNLPYVHIAEREGMAVGLLVVKDSEVGITISPDLRGQGYGIKVLDLLPDCYMTARIRVENKASIRIFEKAGFERSAEIDEILIYKRGRTEHTTSRV